MNDGSIARYRLRAPPQSDFVTGRAESRRGSSRPGSARWVAPSSAAFGGVVILAVLGFAFADRARAAETDESPSRPADPVVELFTSHGCSSCPPADRLLGALLEKNPALIGLEYHVDYWNSLVHGVAGSFVDPFSDSAWSFRQRDYDERPLTGRTGIFTPQAIVDGRHAAVGSDERGIVAALRRGHAEGPKIRVSRDGDVLRISVDGVRVGERAARTVDHLPAPAPDTGEVALVRFLRERRTAITGGENRGLELVNHHVVIAVEPLGRVGEDGSLRARTTAPNDSGEGCAVLVRYGDRESRLGGRLCPEPA